MSESQNLVGGYSPFTCEIDAQAKSAFEDALSSFLGVAYSPVAVSTQVVSGLNYKFFCNSVAIYPGAVSHPAMVSIYKSLDNKSSVTHIVRIGD